MDKFFEKLKAMFSQNQKEENISQSLYTDEDSYIDNLLISADMPESYCGGRYK